jgi:hypothetical protein
MRQRVVMESKLSEGGQLLVQFGFGRSALGGNPPKDESEEHHYSHMAAEHR